MVPAREEIALVVVATSVCDHEVVDAVVGVPRPGHEVVYLPHRRRLLLTVEATVLLEHEEVLSHGLPERTAPHGASLPSTSSSSRPPAARRRRSRPTWRGGWRAITSASPRTSRPSWQRRARRGARSTRRPWRRR